MRAEVLEYVKSCTSKHGRLLPKRAYVVNFGAGWEDGAIRRHCEDLGFTYVSQDIESYAGVDVVSDVYEAGENFENVDLALLLETVEHLERPWDAVDAIEKAMRAGGLIVVTAPIVWEEHKYPLDCWRVMPDGMRFLLRNFELLNLTEEDAVKETRGKPASWKGIFACARKIE